MNNSMLPRTPAIVFTGDRSEDHFIIRCFEMPVRLTHATLQALVDLTIARDQCATGYLSISPVCIRRLRQCLDHAKTNLGATLIETGCGQEYRLRISKQELTMAIVVDPSFRELVQLGTVSQEQVERLARIGALGNCAEIEGQSRRNRRISKKKSNGN